MIDAWVISFGLILVRIATFWMVLPIWSTVQVPRMIKLGLVLSLTWFWVTGLKQPTPSAIVWAAESPHWFYLVMIVARELVFGGLMGLAFMIFLVPAQIAGAYIGQELGLSLATLTDTTSGAANNIVATLFQAFAVTLFFILDFHHLFIYFLDSSFSVQPAGQAWHVESLGTAINGFAAITAQGLVICSPIAIVSLIALAALLLLVRAAPALNLFAIGIPIRLLIGLAAIILFLPPMLTSLHNQFYYGIEFLESLLF